jgi:hypothetical protein
MFGNIETEYESYNLPIIVKTMIKKLEKTIN